MSVRWLRALPWANWVAALRREPWPAAVTGALVALVGLLALRTGGSLVSAFESMAAVVTRWVAPAADSHAYFGDRGLNLPWEGVLLLTGVFLGGLAAARLSRIQWKPERCGGPRGLTAFGAGAFLMIGTLIAQPAGWIFWVVASTVAVAVAWGSVGHE